MATFGLVHGAGHGAWCWERLIPILEGLGHRAFAMDLPCEDPTAGAERYAEVVDRALPPASDLVLVGHSLAGLTVPLVAARRPVQAARLPVRARPGVQAKPRGPGCGRPRALPSGAALAPRPRDRPGRDRPVPGRGGGARRLLPGLHRRRTSAGLFAHLRPQAAAPRREPCPLSAWPAGEKAYILCREDRAISPAWSRRVARERLGVEPIELDGSHSLHPARECLHLPALDPRRRARPPCALTLARAGKAAMLRCSRSASG